MERVPINNHGSTVALAVSIVAILLFVGGVMLSREITNSAQSVGSSTKPVDPGSIQDHKPAGNKGNEQPLQNNNVPPAMPQR